ESVKIAKHMIIGKIFNSENLLRRTVRDHALRVEVDRIMHIVDQLRKSRIGAMSCSNLEELRGIEGNAASAYNSVFDECILQQKDVFYFHDRNRRPPLDPVNALLSFAYSLLTVETAAAL